MIKKAKSFLSKPRNLWVLLSVLFILTLSISAGTLFHFSAKENQHTVDAQLQFILTSFLRDLKNKQYESFLKKSENLALGQYLEISGPDFFFSSHKLSFAYHCASRKSETTIITLCRPFSSPLIFFLIPIGLFTLISFIFFRQLPSVKQESHPVAQPDLKISITGILQGPEPQKKALPQPAVPPIKPESRASSPPLPQLPSTQLLPLLQNVVSEKNVQFQMKPAISIELRTDSTSYYCFSHIDPVEFKKVISGLIVNGVLAIENYGNVIVGLSMDEEWVQLTVSNTGKPIAKETLEKIFGFSSQLTELDEMGKHLFFANSQAQSWKGTFKIQFQPNQDSVLMISLPTSEPPSWFLRTIRILPEMTVVSIHDNPSLHGVWHQRFRDFNRSMGVQSVHLSSPEELLSWLELEPQKKFHSLYLMDHHFNNSNTDGLRMISSLGLEKKCILVTNRYEETHIQQGCLEIGVRLLPKIMVPFVPIQAG